MSRHGLLLIRKPADFTSHDIVRIVKKKLDISAVGHAGTLDPMATGLMVLLLGEGTKLSDYILNGDKAYRLKVQLGITTDTLDITGKILSQTDVQLDPDRIVHAARSLEGSFEWPVPIFSAVKVKGQKLYAYAHHNKEPEFIPKKSMKFWDLKAVGATPNSFEGHIHCSKGSYIRTWASQLGQNLGVGGALAELERTVSAPYELSSALSLDVFDRPESDPIRLEAWNRAFVTIEDALRGWPAYTVRGKDEKLLYNGQISFELERRLVVEAKRAIAEDLIIPIRVMSAETQRIIAILQAVPNASIKIRRVFKMT